MAAVGDEIVLARMPGYRVAVLRQTSDSATYTTTETVVMTITADLISGVIYRITSSGGFEINADGEMRHAIREDNVSGTVIALEDLQMLGAGSNVYRSHLVAEYTAVATGSKTFVATGDVTSGGGTANLNASSTNTSWMYVEVVG